MPVANLVHEVTTAIEAEHNLLGWQLQTGREVNSEDVVRVFGARITLLQIEGKHSEAVELLETALKYLKSTEGPEHPDCLAMRELAAITELQTGSVADALIELDLLYDSWDKHGDIESMARVKYMVMHHYSQTCQHKLAWQSFTHHIDVFDKSSLPATAVFCSTLCEVVNALGKSDASMMLENWLALVEDMEWETDSDKQAENSQWFETYRNMVGGLKGLLKLSCH